MKPKTFQAKIVLATIVQPITKSVILLNQANLQKAANPLQARLNQVQVNPHHQANLQKVANLLQVRLNQVQVRLLHQANLPYQVLMMINANIHLRGFVQVNFLTRENIHFQPVRQAGII